MKDVATGGYSLQGSLDPAGSHRLLHHSLFTWNRQVLSLFGDNTNIVEVLFLFTLLLIILSSRVMPSLGVSELP